MIILKIIKFWIKHEKHELNFNIRTSKVDKKRCIYIQCKNCCNETRFILDDE